MKSGWASFMSKELEEGLSRVFLSSTFRDLEEERKSLIERFDTGLIPICMERFRPRGILSQEVSIEDLEKSDLAIFVISNRYGSPIKGGCKFIDSCIHKECGMKNNTENISYTHCEYRYTIATNKPHWTYIIDDGRTDQLNEEVKAIKDEIKNFECYSSIKQDEQFVNSVIEHYVGNLLDWYEKKKIRLNKFCGRRKKLKELIKKINNSGGIEVIGVGGIGKTTLCDVALLITKLLGRDVIYLGGTESHASETGYKYRGRKIKAIHSENVTLDLIADMMKLGEIINKQTKIRSILHRMDQGKGIILYIDNYQEDDDVRELIKQGNNQLNQGCILLTAKKDMRLTSNKMQLDGIEDRIELVEIFAERINRKINKKEKEEIAKISEGHPIATYLLVSNLERINIGKLKGFKEGHDFSDKDVLEYIDRVIEGILKPTTREILKDIALIDEKLDRESLYEAVTMAYHGLNAKKIIGELLDTFLLKRDGDCISWSFNQIKEAIYEEEKGRHNLAVQYYIRKEENYDNKIEDTIGKNYHITKMGNSIEVLIDYGNISLNILINKQSIENREEILYRMIKWGEALEVEGEIKANILWVQAHFYNELSVFFRDRKKRNMIALQLLEEALELYEEKITYANIQDRLGITYQHLSTVEDKKRYCMKSIDAYVIALGIYEDSDLTQEFASSLNNLGCTYNILAEVELKEINCKKAIKIFEKALNIRTINKNRIEYAETQSNLGQSYRTLSESEDPVTNCNNAIKAYEEALKILNLNNSAFSYINTLSNLGAAYGMLAIETDNTVFNCTKAIEIYGKVLDIIEENEMSIFYAQTLRGKGTAYGILATKENKSVNYKIAIKANKKASEIFEINNMQYDQAIALMNLATNYKELAEVEEKTLNCRKSLLNYKKAIKCYPTLPPDIEKLLRKNINQLREFCFTNRINFNISDFPIKKQ